MYTRKHTQTHTHTHTHTHTNKQTHTRKHVLTLNTRHEYATQWNALFCIILLYKMLEVHVFFKLCRWCNCNGDKCVDVMMMMRRRRKKRSFWKREQEVVNLSGMVEFVSLESSDKTEPFVGSSTASKRRTVGPLPSESSAFLFFKGIVQQFGKCAPWLSCWKIDGGLDGGGICEATGGQCSFIGGYVPVSLPGNHWRLLRAKK